jgi:primary-amine oxidase
MQSQEFEQADFPLTPLSAAEISRAVALMVALPEVTGPVAFPYVGLVEPPKRYVQQFRGAAVDARTMERRAEVITYDHAHGVSYRGVINLQGNNLEKVEQLTGIQPPFLNQEGIYPMEILRQDPRFQEAMRRRGITDLSKVHIEIWMAPDDPAAKQCAHRIVKGIPFYQEEVIGNKYARPIEGVIGTIRLDGDSKNPNPRVLEVVDTGIRPVPADPFDFMGEPVVALGETGATAGALAAENPTVRVHNHLIEWDNWRLRYGIHPREGLILYTVQFRSGDQWKDVLYRGSVSEFVVPYGDPEKTWQWRSRNIPSALRQCPTGS